MDQIVAISGAVARYEKRNLGVREDRIQIIPNGIEMSEIARRSVRPFQEIPRLLFVGRLVPQKGHAVLLNALARVPPPWQLEVVGTGPLERDLRELTERLGIASRVHFLGEQRDVNARYANADLFCFPSQWEGMGLVLVEAMAAGTPILASDLLATREFAPKSRLVDPASIDAWAEAIRTTLADPSSAIAEAQKAEPVIRKKFGVEQMVERYAEMYRSIIKA
jgi:glycosyltransferase involved in cell wall biosynthesis